VLPSLASFFLRFCVLRSRTILCLPSPSLRQCSPRYVAAREMQATSGKRKREPEASTSKMAASSSSTLTQWPELYSAIQGSKGEPGAVLGKFILAEKSMERAIKSSNRTARVLTMVLTLCVPPHRLQP
jgi:hypothetical protein